MHRRTGVAVVALVLLLGGAGAYGLYTFSGSATGLSPLWVSDTATATEGNHHAPAVARVGSRSIVLAPISGQAGTDQCSLTALSGADGSIEWRYEVPATNCTIHSVADPTVADSNGDGRMEVLATTTEQILVDLDLDDGTMERTNELSTYGYTRPVIVDLNDDGTSETVVVDAKGVAFAFDGTETMWTTDLAGQVWSQPAVDDFDADGDPEIAVGLGSATGGSVVVLEANGTESWRLDGIEGSVTWLTTGQADDDEAVELVAATAKGRVVCLDGVDGAEAWHRDGADFAAVEAFGDGDGDGEPEVYVTAKDATVTAVDASTGDDEWSTTLTTERVQMTPPPVLGDVDGDGSDELVVASNDGVVSIVDPAAGGVLATYDRDVMVYAPPVVADLDGRGGDEIVVTYGDGRVVALNDATNGE